MPTHNIWGDRVRPDAPSRAAPLPSKVDFKFPAAQEPGEIQGVAAVSVGNTNHIAEDGMSGV